MNIYESIQLHNQSKKERPREKALYFPRIKKFKSPSLLTYAFYEIASEAPGAQPQPHPRGHFLVRPLTFAST